MRINNPAALAMTGKIRKEATQQLQRLSKLLKGAQPVNNLLLIAVLIGWVFMMTRKGGCCSGHHHREDHREK